VAPARGVIDRHFRAHAPRDYVVTLGGGRRRRDRHIGCMPQAVAGPGGTPEIGQIGAVLMPVGRTNFGTGVSVGWTAGTRDAGQAQMR
jgi:hypothetical protein